VAGFLPKQMQQSGTEKRVCAGSCLPGGKMSSRSKTKEGDQGIREGGWSEAATQGTARSDNRHKSLCFSRKGFIGRNGSGVFSQAFRETTDWGVWGHWGELKTNQWPAWAPRGCR